MMMRSRLHFFKDRAGTAGAEMALILPLALALLFTMFEGGYYLWSEHKVVKGVRDAARYAARLDFSNYACPAGTFSGNSAYVQDLARTGKLTGGTAKVPGWARSHVTISVSCAAGQSGLYSVVGGNAPRVTVSATVPYPSLFSAFGFGTGTLNLRASAQSPVMGL